MSLKMGYESMIRLDDFPVQWIESFQLYHPDLPHFPIVYVHLKKGGRRIFGCPVSVNFEMEDGPKCHAEVTFISNEDLEGQPDLKSAVRNELMERFGLTNRVTLGDVIQSCNGNQQYEGFFRELWKRVETVSGDSIPFGRFYEELFSIVRFVSAWNPKTGRQSEMRMLYNFMSIFGEKAEIEGKWGYLEFYLLPTYKELTGTDLSDFPKFRELVGAIMKIQPEFFNSTESVDGRSLLGMEKGWGKNKDEFMENVTNRLLDNNTISSAEKQVLDRLVDAFNRHPGRASYFVWSVLNSFLNDYTLWDRNLFIAFYLNQESKMEKGVSEKVVACYLQQGFGNPDAIPIDTWVGAFHTFPLGLDRKGFLEGFSNPAKLERVIWLASQMKKTNLLPFFDILWCIRFGTNGNTYLRGANPIACYECSLREVCPGYSKISDSKVFITESFNEAEGPPSDCKFVCETENGIPKKSYVLEGKRNRKWILTDEFSGYIIDGNFVPPGMMESAVRVEDMIRALGPFRAPSSAAVPEL